MPCSEILVLLISFASTGGLPRPLAVVVREQSNNLQFEPSSAPKAWFSRC